MMIDPSENKKGRLSGLEVVRGLAALSIVIFHLKAIYIKIPEGPLNTLVNSFSGAVPVFFALSAFSLLYGYSDRLLEKKFFARFYIRRIFRIFPLFYLMLAIYICKAMVAGVWVSRGEILVNMFFLFPFLTGKHESLVWAGWSLGVEFFFYMIFPVFALIAGKLRLNIGLFVCFIGITYITPILITDLGLVKSYGTMNFPYNLLFFQTGVLVFSTIQYLLLAKFYEKINIALTPKMTILIATSFIFLTILKIFNVLPFLILTTACIIWIFLAYIGFPTWLDNSFTRLSGRISYSIYLTHPFLLWVFSKSGIYSSISIYITDPYLYFFACTTVTLTSVFLLSLVTYSIIESPGIKLGEFLSRKAWVTG